MKSQPFMLVDAFADQVMTGNSAGVVFCDEPLSEKQMQTIAREVNASETSFLTDIKDATAKLRWFTPTVEMDFCGHATVAAAHALFARSRAANPDNAQLSFEFDTAAGTLPVTGEIAGDASPDNPVWWLQVPTPQLEPARVNAMQLAEVLGCAIDDFDTSIPMMLTKTRVLVVFVASWQILANLRPNFAAMTDWCNKNRIRDIGVSTTKTATPVIHASSRFFAPALGVDEDPVTGTLHGPLCLILAQRDLAPQHDGMHAMNCVQGIPGDRGGRVLGIVDLRNKKPIIKIGGKAAVSVKGEIAIPAVGD